MLPIARLFAAFSIAFSASCHVIRPPSQDEPHAPARRAGDLDVEPYAARMQLATANDNRMSAGNFDGEVLTLALEARTVKWRADLGPDSAVTIHAFGEAGKPPSVPGPLLRVREGTQVRVTVRNAIPDSALVVHGLRAGTVSPDTIHLKPGAVRQVTYTASEPGTFLYWGTITAAKAVNLRFGREGQLNGAIVVDSASASRRTADRVIVISWVDVFEDSVRNRSKDDFWRRAINGRSWPNTERLQYSVGDTIRWRMINATGAVHPMHLHGFHFRTLAKGNGQRDTVYARSDVRLGVTEMMEPGSTAAIEWVPTRAGNWLFHCHMLPHITPFPARPDSVRAHDVHQLLKHPEYSMAGLVMGVTTVHRGSRLLPWRREPRVELPVSRAAHHERLFIQEASDTVKRIPRGFVLQRGAEPRSDSVLVPGSPLILRQGVRTTVTVINRLKLPTAVHWHGMELESFFDGVPGYSGSGTRRAPLVLPGDSFTVAFTPPRAGTYIYHSHMDEEDQIGAGMYAPMIVLAPGETFDPRRDLVFLAGRATVKGVNKQALNGQHVPAPLSLVAGTTYRLRAINMLPAAPLVVRLVRDSIPEQWRVIAKDGATLARPRASQAVTSRIGVGETYDFEWTPRTPMRAELQFSSGANGFTLVQPLIVNAPGASSSGGLRGRTSAPES